MGNGLIFQRFGNAFVAIAADETLYVVSYYLSAWSTNYRTVAMESPEKVGLYSNPTPEAAAQVAEAHNLERMS